jgi:hypothetical protein
MFKGAGFVWRMMIVVPICSCPPLRVSTTQRTSLKLRRRNITADYKRMLESEEFKFECLKSNEVLPALVRELGRLILFRSS